MPETIKTKAYKRIVWYVKLGYSANKIQKTLAKQKLGVRRKVLLEEIRYLRKTTVTPEKRKKGIPKKYRKKEIPIPPPPKPKAIYRCSLTILDVPVHSKAFKRNYLGFRLNAFCFDPNYLNHAMPQLQDRLVELANQYIKSDYIPKRYTDIGIKSPELIPVYNPEALNKRWVFTIEREGIERFHRSGVI